MLEVNISRLSNVVLNTTFFDNLERNTNVVFLYHLHWLLLDDSGNCLSHLSLFEGEGHNHLLGLTYVELKQELPHHSTKSFRAEL